MLAITAVLCLERVLAKVLSVLLIQQVWMRVSFAVVMSRMAWSCSSAALLVSSFLSAECAVRLSVCIITIEYSYKLPYILKAS